MEKRVDGRFCPRTSDVMRPVIFTNRFEKRASILAPRSTYPVYDSIVPPPAPASEDALVLRNCKNKEQQSTYRSSRGGEMLHTLDNRQWTLQ